MTGMREAFCYETNALEPADLAVHKRDVQGVRHHYFCASRECAHPVDGAHWHETGIAWYRSKPITATEHHAPSCPHKMEPSGVVNKSEPNVSGVDNIRKVLVPNLLGKADSSLIRSWPNPPPPKEELAAMAAQAKPIQLAGSLSDVVNAYEGIKGERRDHSLEINGHKTNYSDGIKWIWDLSRPWTPEVWQHHVVLSYCTVKAGTKRGGIWFLDTLLSKENHLAGDSPVSFTVRYEELAQLVDRKTVGQTLDDAAANNKRVKLYWQGPEPIRNDKGGASFTNGDRPVHECFVIRPM